MRTDEARVLLEDERRHLDLTRAALALFAGPGIETNREDAGERSRTAVHLADVASDTLESEVDLGLLRSVEGDLAAVDAAIGRLGDGTYGRCRACGQPIGDARLRARPAARLCLDHQRLAEISDASLRGEVLHGSVELEAVAHLDLLPVEGEAHVPPCAEEEAIHPVW